MPILFPNCFCAAAAIGRFRRCASDFLGLDCFPAGLLARACFRFPAFFVFPVFSPRFRSFLFSRPPCRSGTPRQGYEQFNKKLLITFGFCKNINT